MLFEKWYFDYQADHEFGYYYVGNIRWKGLSLSFAEAHQAGRQGAQHHFYLGRSCKKSFRMLATRNARICFERDYTDLKIRMNGRWTNARWIHHSMPMPQTHRPLFQNRRGNCQWKVWMPHATVTDQSNGRIGQPLGSGYIDYVRLTIPLWHLPFQTLYWGRLFSGRGDWIILFNLQTPDRELIYLGDRTGWQAGRRLYVQKRLDEQVQCFCWQFDCEHLDICPIKVLQRGAVLNTGRGRWLPQTLRDKLSTNGFEQKYLVEAKIRDQRFRGIMEEVRWHHEK